MAGERVLIVEIERRVSREMRANLEGLQRSFEIIEVLSGEEATLVFQNTPVDLLVVDTHLPGMDAFELIAKLRAQKPDLNLILLNGNPTPLSTGQLSRVRPDVILKKPLHSHDFLGAIERIMGSGHTQYAVNPPPEIESSLSEDHQIEPVGEGDESGAIDPEMEEILKTSVEKKIEKEDLDAFWASAGEGNSPQQASTGSLTYDQALEKGLLPDNGPASE